MPAELIAFMQLFFTDELIREMNRSYILLQKFDLNNIEQPYEDILMQHQLVHNDQLIDQFVRQINKHLDFVLKEHTIDVTPETTITQKNEILSALLLVQDLEDYTGVISALESMAPNEEQLADVISMLSSLSKEDVMLSIESFNPNILNTLKKYIEQKSEVSLEEPNPKILASFKLFCQCFGRDSIGCQLVDSGLLLNQPFETYLSYYKELLTEGDAKLIALNMYSLLIVSSDGNTDTMKVFREHSLDILVDLNKVKAVETELTQLISKYQQIKQVENEKARLP